VDESARGFRQGRGLKIASTWSERSLRRRVEQLAEGLDPGASVPPVGDLGPQAGLDLSQWAGTGSNRRPCGFQPGTAHPAPSGMVRPSRICPGQQGSRRRGHSGWFGLVRLGADQLGRTTAESRRRRRRRACSLVGAAALRVAGLAWQGRPPPAAPDKRAPPATALLGGALAGSGPGTSPCIDGLSLVSGGVPSALLDQTLRTTMAALEQVARRGNAGSTNRPLACKARSGKITTWSDDRRRRSQPAWHCPWLSAQDRSGLL
jgi:hypothetical protein